MDPSWVALESSRGIETESHKLFMRISVLITFWIIYIPPIIAYIEFFSFYKPKVNFLFNIFRKFLIFRYFDQIRRFNQFIYCIYRIYTL